MLTPGSSEQQSQVLSTLKDLADEKLLQMKNEIMKTVEKARKEDSASLANLSVQLSSLAEASRDQKILCILNSLDFETRQSRQSDISETEHRTFEWIFDNNHGSSNQRVGFREWLQYGNDIYWISGKAGSGKSVLMNYIANEPRTQELLQSWAGETRLIIAKYFFWNAGAPMQKSQQGLLQSLLREIYGQCPELVPMLCPRWKRYYDIGATWTRLELSEAFKKLGRQSSLSLKFAFFVDGVDEYDGEDYMHIIGVLKDLNALPSVKICLSSRPWNIFITAFGADTHQRLLLEDHNGDDIQRYVKNRFERDKQFALLQSRDPRSSDLVDQIVRDAQGVFLWVRLVVSNLLRGLSNDDSLSDLQRRLRSLPTDLTAYFQHMFDSIDGFYREETSEMLLICLEGIQPLSLLALWYYEKEMVTPDYALQAKRCPLTSADVLAIFESIRRRINARGQDLLEIEAGSTTDEHLMYTVRFSHRTVKDFLSEPDMLKRLTSWKSKDFDARASLCRATLAMAKSLPSLTNMDTVNATEAFRCRNLVSNFFTYACLIEKDNGTLDDVLVDELQRVSSSYRKKGQRDTYLKRLFDCSIWILDRWARWTAEHDVLVMNKSRAESFFHYGRDMADLFLVLAVEANLKRYIEHKLAIKPNLISRSFWQRPILDRALRPPPLIFQIISSDHELRIDPDMIRLLLTRGADPNEALTIYKHGRASSDTPILYTSEKAWTTVWALFLQRLREDQIHKFRKPPYLVQNEFEATKVMIENGAAADLRPWRILALQNPSDGPPLTPSDVFHEVFPPHNAVVLDRLLRKHRPWALRQVSSWVRRTMLLWFYRDIDMIVWSLTSLYPIFFNQTLGVILPMVIIPTLGYFLWHVLLLVWPLTSPIISGTAPVLLSALIFSDWIPILDGLIWLNNLLLWRDSSLFFNKCKVD